MYHGKYLVLYNNTLKYSDKITKYFRGVLDEKANE